MFSKFKQSLNKSALRKNMFLMLQGTVISEGIQVLITPILTRGYKPDEFGYYSLFLSFATIIETNITLRFAELLVISKKNSHSVYLYSICTIIIAIISLVLIAFNFLPEYFFDKNTVRILIYLPFLSLFAGLFQLSYYSGVKSAKFNLIKHGKVVQAGVSGLLMVACVYYELSIAYVISSYLLGFIGFLIPFALALKIKDKIKNFLKFVKGFYSKKVLSSMFENTRYYFRYSSNLIVGGLLYSFTVSMPNLYFARFFESADVANYFMAYSISLFPGGILSSAITDAAYKESSDLLKEGKNLNNYMERTTARLLLLGVVPYLVLFLYGPELLSFVLGQDWSQSSSYIKLFSIPALLSTISVPLMLFNQVGKPFKFLEWQGIRFVIMIISLFIGYLFNEVEFSIYMICIAQSLAYLALLFYNFKLSEAKFYNSISLMFTKGFYKV